MSDRYTEAKERYAVLGVDTEKALEKLKDFSLSLHCWQADDVGGFESEGGELSGGGIQATGNYPGKAGNLDELKNDLEYVYGLIPGRHRLNLHASYGDFSSGKTDRDAIEPKHFADWVGWAKEQGVKLDFNCTMFSHPKADDGFTLASKDKGLREFWIAHTERAREIAAYMGREQGTPAVHNLWIPDGMKDYPADRAGYRKILLDSLDRIFTTEYPSEELRDVVESKLFGIGSEAYVVGSHDFYLSYAISRNKMVCLDMGHFHPTELVADEVSAVLQFQDSLLLHVSRPMRWDSDHIVVFNDDLNFMAQEVVRNERGKEIFVGLDFFDASVNRIGAYAVGARAALKAWLSAYLEPTSTLISLEEEGNYIGRMALSERLKSMPMGDVWERFCEVQNVPGDDSYMDEVFSYEQNVLSRRT